MRTCIIASIIAMSVPGPGLEEPVGGLGGGGADRVDHDDLGAVGAGLLDGRPQVTVGELGVRRPQDDQLGVADLERIHAERRAVGHRHAGADGRPADRAHETARTEVVEEPAADALHGEEALVAGVAERQDRLGAVGVDHVVQARRDLGERVVPRDPLELAAALRPGAPERVQDAVGAVDAVEEAVDLGAQLALAVRVVGVAAELDRDGLGRAVVDGHRPPARVGTVVVTGAVHGAHPAIVRDVPREHRRDPDDGEPVCTAAVRRHTMSRVATDVIEQQHGRYLLSTDRARVDVDAVHRFLERIVVLGTRPAVRGAGDGDRQQPARGRRLSRAGSDGGEQVGFARMVTDLATFAWLADVYVLEEHRGGGLGTAMVRLIVEHPAVGGLPLQLPGHGRRARGVRACRLRDRRGRNRGGGWLAGT